MSPYNRKWRYLDLADNGFRSLHRCAFPVSTSALKRLSIIGNPVVCNCSLAWLAAEQGDAASRRVVWGTCRHEADLNRTYPRRDEPPIDTVVKLARTCTAFDVPDCRFD